MKLNIVFTFFLLALISLGCLGQASVSASLSNREMLIGDHINLSIYLNSENQITKPEIILDGLAKIEHLEIIKEDNWTTDISKKNWTKQLLFSVFDTGYITIVPMPITYISGQDSLTVFTPDLLLKVNAPPLPDSLQLKPIKYIIEEKRQFSDFLPLVGGVLLVALLGAGIYWFLNRKKNTKTAIVPTVIRPPDEIALEKLDALKAQNLWQKGEIKTYQTRLTFIIREYIEGRYNVLALESTSDELIKLLADSDVPVSHMAHLKELLSMADLVKFAKAIPPPDIHSRMFDQTVEFVINTRPKIELIK